MMKLNRLSILLSAALLALASCSGLTKEAKEMAGDYYIPEISSDTPLMELNSNGHCIIRAIRPGSLTYQVPGRWNVKRDSLLVTLDPAGLTFEGDSTLIGHVPEHLARKVEGFNGVSLTLSVDGINYVYYRRGHTDK